MLHNILTVADVMERYKCSRQTAAKIMNRLPSFKVGNRLFVREVDLGDYEEKRTAYPVSRKTVRGPERVTIPRRRA